MGIFDNAKSIFIGEKEVKSLEIDGGTIYEKDEPTPPVKRTITLTLKANGGQVSDARITILLNGVNTGVETDISGVATLEVEDGTYTVTSSTGRIYSPDITVDEDHTVFTVIR